MNEYLQLLEKFHIETNFWCSEEYFSKAGLKERKEGEFIGVYDGNILMFPVFHETKGIVDWEEEIFSEKIWSDFFSFDFPRRQPEFLDYEYIYDPREFLDMRGKKWMVFRKNSRKFSKRLNKKIFYTKEDLEDYEEGIQKLFIDWLSRLSEDTKIHDDQVMELFIFEGQNRGILLDEEGIVYGLNVWDENYLYVNFRYCLCGDFPFLGEYLRLLFYLDMVSKKKLVNDGGILDNSKLKFFKDKLNPVKVREVKSWNRGEQ